MRIEHVAVYVSDLEGCKSFFEKYFGCTANDKYFNANTGFSSYFLSFNDGSRLEIMNKPNLSLIESDNRLGYVHLAFSVGSKEKVDELTSKLLNDGFRVLSGPRTTGDGYYESLVEVFENNLIEITV